jgi:hypothetical protein
MASPSLVIRRVVVEGNLSCDLEFERGLSIVQAVPTGDDEKTTHKSGKTSLVELIQHGLGRVQESRTKFHFAPIIDQIRTLWLEIEANGEILTIERSLQSIEQRARVREGEYAREMKDLPAEQISIEDMSSLLLRALNIPQVAVKTAKGDLFPLTFPTLMRAFILHQDDSFGGILDKMIPEQRRTDVIGFLSGIIPANRFEIEEKLAAVQTEAQEVENYFNSVQSFLYRNEVPTLIEAHSRVTRAEEALQAAVEAQRNLQQEIREATTRQSERLSGRIDSLRSQLFAAKDEAGMIERGFIGLQQEEERLEEVLRSLKDDRKKAQRLRASSTILSSVEFSICPRCLLEITDEMKQREKHARCELCNRPLRTTSDMPPRATPRTEDINSQIEETETVLKDVRREKTDLQRELERLRSREAEISRQLDLESQAYVSPAVDSLLARAHEVAQREADLARAKSLLSQALALEEIRGRLNELKGQQAELEEQLKEARKANRQRLDNLRAIYEQVLIDLDFPGFRECSINPQTLMPYINGNLYIHMGVALRGLATVAYHLALLQLSRAQDAFFPRMLVIDSPAVGDLNEESHDKLLRYFAKLASGNDNVTGGLPKQMNGDEPDWQIILTTRRLVPELEPYVKERISRPDHLLLRRR